jgi:NitT/TauT family transport system substrate-binding protein
MQQLHKRIIEQGRQLTLEMTPLPADRRVVQLASAFLSCEDVETGFTHPGLCLTVLPYRALKPHEEWRRTTPNLTLSVQPLRDMDGHLRGVPYGTKARLILLYLQSEAVRSHSPEIELGASGQTQTEDTLRLRAVDADCAAPRAGARVPSVPVAPLGGIAGQIPSASAEPLKIAYGSPWVGWGPLYIAEEKGYFKDEGLEVELAYFDWDTPQEGFDLLANKRIDGRLGTLDESTLYWKPESPFIVVLALDVSSGGDGVLVRTDRNIESVGDLKGKKVGLERTTPSHFLLSYLLKQNGLSEADVTIVNMSPEDAAAAVVAGDVDAAVTWNPYLTNAAEDTNVEVLLTSEDTPGLIADVLLMPKDMVDSNPETCQRVVRAWNKAIDYQQANPDESAAIMAKGLNYGTAENVKADLAGLALQGRDENARFFEGDGPGTALGTASFAIELWTELGRLTTPVKAEDLIDARCLEK